MIALAAERPSVKAAIDGLKRAEHVFFESGKLRFRYARTATVNMTTNEEMRRAEWLLGRDGGGWYTEGRELDPEVRRNVAIPAEPTIHILKNGQFLDWTQFNRNVFLGPKEKRNFNVLHGWQYLENVGLNPYRPVVESAGMSFEEAGALDEASTPEMGLITLRQFLSAPLLPDFLELNASKYSVAEDPESIDGEACWVIEWPEMDKIWVNVDHGYAVRRRVFHWKPGGPLARQVDNSDFRQIQPDLWLPFQQAVESYGRLDGDEADVGKVINRATYEVSECDFSSAPDALTMLRLPVGTFVTDAIRNVQYTVSDEQGDPFEKALGEAAATRMPQSSTSLVAPLIIAGNAVAVLVAIFFFLRRRKASAAVLVAVFSLPTGAAAQGRTVTPLLEDRAQVVDDKGEWLWKPSWLEMNACGPNSLYVLLKLLGQDLTLDQVMDRVACDPILGCSMADLSDAASAFGVPADVRFVRPNELAAVPFPFILHGTSGLKAKTGHFVVVVGRDSVKHRLATIDPIRESFGWNPEAGFVRDYSGYILVPRRHSVARPSVLLGIGLTLLSIGLLWRYGTAGAPTSAKHIHDHCAIG